MAEKRQAEKRRCIGVITIQKIEIANQTIHQ